MDLVSMTSYLSKLGLTVGSLLVFATVFLLYRRTSSVHPFLTLLWMRAFGKLVVHDAKVQAYVDEMNNLSRFTFQTKIKSRTLPDAHALLDWRQHWNVALAQVHACGNYFDLDEPGLKSGKKLTAWLAMGLAVFSALFILGGAFSAGFMAADKALVTFRKSGETLWLTESTAQRFSWQDHSHGVLQLADCKTKPADLSQRTGFGEGQLSTLCNFFEGKDVSNPRAYVELKVSENRIAFAGLSILLFIFALVTWPEMLRAMAAVKLADHLERRAKKLTAAKVSTTVDEAQSSEIAKGAPRLSATSTSALGNTDSKNSGVPEVSSSSPILVSDPGGSTQASMPSDSTELTLNGTRKRGTRRPKPSAAEPLDA